MYELMLSVLVFSLIRLGITPNRYALGVFREFYWICTT